MKTTTIFLISFFIGFTVLEVGPADLFAVDALPTTAAVDECANVQCYGEDTCTHSPGKECLVNKEGTECLTRACEAEEEEPKCPDAEDEDDDECPEG